MFSQYDKSTKFIRIKACQKKTVKVKRKELEVNQTSQPVQGNFQQMHPQGVPEQKGKTKKVFTQLQLTSQLTYTHWVNLSKKELVSCLKQLSALTNLVRT